MSEKFSLMWSRPFRKSKLLDQKNRPKIPIIKKINKTYPFKSALLLSLFLRLPTSEEVQ